MKTMDLLALLEQRGLIRGQGARCSPLGGGVSSDIWLVKDGANKFVVKRALPKLRVSQDWYADVSRNRHEQDYVDYVAEFLPDAVPHIMYRAPEHGFFTMEYLGPEYENWKTMLLGGQAMIEHATQAARILATIHRQSWNDADCRVRFATTPQFYQLRVEPYLLSTALKHPHLRNIFQQEADRLAATSLCLVHGDFSPKNILIGPDRMVLLDCEVAWFGDPAFDVAFLLNHFFLKALLFHKNPQLFLAMAETAHKTYFSELDAERRSNLEERVVHLLLMLLLARVDGKSPVQYLTNQEKKECVRTFACRQLPQMPDRLLDLSQAWEMQINQMPACQKPT
ncbi:MAG TPA: aminoglycoside phosphotransferase family protein [Gemmataceae bacterium]|nr:aminoglycoside phosphotransferase family protein [Gemmataceae bacterium]